jgi:hypothetical protein
VLLKAPAKGINNELKDMKNDQNVGEKEEKERCNAPANESFPERH